MTAPALPPRRRAAPAANGATLACAAALGGCSVFTTMYSTPGPRPDVHPLPVAGTDLFDWKGIVHCHSYLSHDSKGTIAEIAAACRKASVDFVAMTDHQTDASIRDGQRGMVGDTLFMVGCEQRCPQGTIMAFPLTTPIKRWQHAGLLIKDTEAQGGVVFICHAELWKSWDLTGLTGLTGVEIVNLHAGVMAPNKIGTLLTGIFLPLRFLFERICWRDAEVFRQWDLQLAARHPFTPVGGDDAHANVRLLGPLGGTIGNYQEVFLTLSTHVLAPHLTEADLVQALRLGRTYVSFDIFGEGAGFDFRAIGRDGVHMGGATVAAADDLRLSVHSPQPGQIQLWRDGAIVQQAEDDVLEVRAPAPGVYRVEVRTRYGSPWLFSSSIKVTPAP
jgi:hypothetical protein